MKCITAYGTYNVSVEKMTYKNNGNLAVQLIDEEDGCPFAMLTVNLGKKLPEGHAYLDTNNCPWAEAFVTENNLAESTGTVGFSGYCMYPLYKFK